MSKKLTPSTEIDNRISSPSNMHTSSSMEYNASACAENRFSRIDLACNVHVFVRVCVSIIRQVCVQVYCINSCNNASVLFMRMLCVCVCVCVCV